MTQRLSNLSLQMMILVIAMVIGLPACAPKLPKPVAPPPSADAPVVVVLRSSENKLFDGPAEAFVDQLKESMVVYESGLGRRPYRTVERLLELEPDLFFALGTKAATTARRHAPSIPTLFAMVVNYKRVPELKAGEVMGVSLELPSFAEFTQFKLVAPNLAKVAAFYSPEASADAVKEAQEQLSTMGVELRPIPVDSADDIPEAYQKVKKDIGAVWFMNDPVVMNAGTFEFLKQATVEDKLPFVSSLSDKFAKSGALMSVSVDFSSLGFQAAAMTKSFLLHDSAIQTVGIQPPIGGKLVLNIEVARLIGLDVPAELLPFINEVVGDVTKE